jgi:hypothetical protein
MSVDPSVERIDATSGKGAHGSVGDELPPGASEDEWIVEGVATRYSLVGDDYRVDGRWRATPAGSAPYRTRVLALRPSPDACNGTAVVVWNNVSVGIDGIYAGPELSRMVDDGFAVLGVSAQHVGVEGPSGLVNADPDRYASLRHPGDDHSYDIFTQVAALAATSHPSLLDGLEVQRVVAAGASQSACRLATLHNALHPSGVVDAYVLVVYAGNGTLVDSTVPGTGFAEVPDNPVAILPFRTHRLRDDLRVPVFVVNSETEACLFTTNQQPDSDHLRVWESAGTSHVGSSRTELPDMGNGAPCRGSFAPALPAAYHHLRRWLEDGTPPPGIERIEREADGRAARDEHGNARGGIRWPHVVVPLGTHRGEAPPGPIDLMGASIPFDAERIRALHHDRADYDARFDAAVDALVERGVVLPEDRSMVDDPLAADVWHRPGQPST